MIQPPTSSILIVGHPNQKDIQLGADFSINLTDAKAKLKTFNFSALVIPIDIETPNELIGFLNDLNTKQKLTQIILIAKSNPELVISIMNSCKVFNLLSNYEPRALELSIFRALEEYDLQMQNENLFILFEEQNKKLESLNKTLEEKIKERLKYLETSKKRLSTSNKKFKVVTQLIGGNSEFKNPQRT